jgi:uncharacterized membrane protein
VPGIGEQRQRASKDAAGDLGDHETACQQRGEPDAALVGGLAMMMRVTMPGVGMIVIVVVVVVVCVSVGMLHKSIRSRRAW